MKRPVLLAIFALSAGLSVQATPGPINLATWTFETSAPTSSGLISPESGIGAGSTATNSHAGPGAPVFSSPLNGGNGSTHAWRSTVWNVGDYYQFKTSSSGGYSAINLSFDLTSSGNGPGRFMLSYSTDGVSFSNVGSSPYTVLQNGSPNPAWSLAAGHQGLYSYNADLSGITALNNQTTIYFRLTDTSTLSASGGTVSGTGNSLIDNFSVTAVPEPQSLFIAGGLGILAWTFIRRRK